MPLLGNCQLQKILQVNYQIPIPNCRYLKTDTFAKPNQKLSAMATFSSPMILCYTSLQTSCFDCETPRGYKVNDMT